VILGLGGKPHGAAGLHRTGRQQCSRMAARGDLTVTRTHPDFGWRWNDSRRFVIKKTCLAILTMLAMLRLAAAQTAPAIPPAISTPDKVETRLGTLDFKDGTPSLHRAAKWTCILGIAWFVFVLFAGTFAHAATLPKDFVGKWCQEETVFHNSAGKKITGHAYHKVVDKDSDCEFRWIEITPTKIQYIHVSNCTFNKIRLGRLKPKHSMESSGPKAHINATCNWEDTGTEKTIIDIYLWEPDFLGVMFNDKKG